MQVARFLLHLRQAQLFEITTMTDYRLNMAAIFLVGMLIFLQYRLWFQTGGLLDVFRLKKALAIQQVETDRLKKINEDLLFQVKRLQNSNEATETRARTELGMVKKGETYYQIVK